MRIFGVIALIYSLSPAAYALETREIRNLAEFPLGVWLENIAVRANGDLLVTRVDKAQVISVRYRTGEHEVLLDFPHTTAALGIAEIQRDVFAVATGNYSITTGTTPGSYSIWLLDLRSGNLKASKAADVPIAGTINGVARLDHRRVLVADTHLGVVYRVDLRTGAFASVISGTEYESVAPPAPPFAVNGLRIVGSTLYFTNTGAGTISRVPITPDGTADGPVVTIAENLELPDDFAVGPDGELYIALHGAQAVDELTASGKKKRIAGGPGSTDFASPTALQYGRTSSDNDTLYVVTGGMRDEAGAASSPAKVLAIVSNAPIISHEEL